jgi:hypothetical protein
VIVVVVGSIGLVVDTGRDGRRHREPAEAPPEAPARIRAHATTDEITIRWTRASDPDIRYQVLRNGAVLVEAQRPTRFSDRDVAPLGSYIYEVRAVGDDGATSASARTVVNVPKPEPATARVEGYFTVKLHERSAHGFRALMPERTAEFIFEPTCLLGRCSTRWTYVEHPGVASTASFRGGAYEARTSGQLDIPCGTSLPVTSLTISFRVTRGAVDGGEWVADRLEGSLREDTSPQFGCVHSSVSYDFTATPLSPQAGNVFRVTNAECRFDGTGFLTSDGYVVTNAHVVAGASSPVVNVNGRAVTATVVAFSPAADLAILDVGPTGDDVGFTLSPSDHTLGRFWAFGFPNGRSLSQYDVTVVRALRRGFSLSGGATPIRGYAFRGDVHHGDSGGPIVGGGSVVLGVVTSGIAGRSGYAVGATEVSDLIATVDRTPVSTGSCYRG